MHLFQRLLLVGIVMTVVVVGLAAYVGSLATSSLEQRITKDRLVSTQAAATGLEGAANNLVEELTFWGSSMPQQPFSAEDNRVVDARLSALLARDDNDGFAAGFLISRDGAVLASRSRKGGPTQVPQDTLSVLQGAVQPNKPIYPPAFLCPDGLSACLPIAVPLTSDDGEVDSYLLGIINVSDSSLPAYLATVTSVLETGHADLLGSDGRVIISTDKDVSLTLGDHPLFYASARSSAVGAQVATVPYEEEDEGPALRMNHVMAYVPLGDVPWALAVGGSVKETFGPVRQFKTRMYWLAGLVLGFTIIGGALGTARLVHPVRVLSLSARRLATGDLTGQINVKEGGEIGDLAQDMETMRVRLKSSLEEIQDLNTDLERRVTERTVQLEQRNRELSAASSIAAKVASSIDLDEVLQQTLESVAEATGQQSLAIFLMDREGKRLTLTAGRGMKTPFNLLETSVDSGECLCGMVAIQGQTRAVLDMRESSVMTRRACAIAGYRCVVSYPLRSRDRIEGVLTLFSPQPNSIRQQDYPLVDLICHQIGVAIQNARLYQEAQEKEKTTHLLLEKVINAQEEERRRLARELHDETGQTFTAIALSLETLRAELGPGQERTRKHLDDLRGMTRDALIELRKMAMALRPSALDDLGLVPAVRRYAVQHLESIGITLKVEASNLDDALSPAHQTVLFRIIQEAINNVARHSKATSATIRFWRERDEVFGEVSDNGVGFEPEKVLSKQTVSAGLGVLGMQERAALVGGRVVITSQQDVGSKIVVCIPAHKGVGNGNGRKN